MIDKTSKPFQAAQIIWNCWINGVLGGSPSGDIGAKGSINGDTGNFIQIKKFVDLRAERLDILA